MSIKPPAVALTGIGLITPIADDIQNLAAACAEIKTPVNKTIETIPPPQNMNSRQLRRMARLSCLALYAADKAVSTAALNGRNGKLYIGLTHGSTSLLQEFHDFLFEYGPQMASPNAFSNGVTNAPLGAVSKLLDLTAGGGTFVGYENCGMEILHFAASAILEKDIDFCCVGASEEYSSLVEDVYKKLSWYNGKGPAKLPLPINSTSANDSFILSEGSLFFSVRNAESAKENSGTGYCYFTPVDDPKTFDQDVDLIISGAGGGPQDSCELEALSQLLSRQKNPPALLFSKCFFGETFALSPLLSSAIAWDILVNKSTYPFYPVHDSLKNCCNNSVDFTHLSSILVVSANRDGAFSLGLFTRG